MWDRGIIRPGAVADLVLIDRDELGLGPMSDAQDFPTGPSRLVWEEEGDIATIVAGEVNVEHGSPRAPHGQVVRSDR